MRIISGIRYGHKLIEFKGDDIRPTTDRVKESVFNIIQSHVIDADVLDMFSGSGALSFEAISRGANRAVCIDKDKRSVEVIRKNAQDLDFTDKCEIINASCFDYMARTDEKFDIIFLDPPYNKGFIEPVLEGIVENELLRDGGIVVLESDNTDYHREIRGLELLKQHRYGRTYITVYSLK
ncbi:MAG: 16S rRNA (guanine(966)-N(2))-methyltransferase RsmD [Oscillospiraceae bacterium]|nr:16S rRNA (guanine(966)-N(2))-methyltransferase RsmD [Oscillospiraceae bacterium]